MDLSIIIPIYNTEIDSFRRCINSVVQDLDVIEYEIWVIDDGSEEYKSNEYYKVIEELKNLNIHYIYKENSGVSSARNLGLNNATGKYIMFLDSDDIVYSKEILYEDFQTDSDIVFYNKIYIKKDGKKYERKEIERETGYVDPRYILKDFIIRNRFYSPVAKIIRKSFLMKHNIRFDTALIQGEDAIFNLEMLLCNPKIYYIDRPIYEYHYDFRTSINRWKKYPDIMFENFYYLYLRKIELIKGMDKDVQEEYLNGLNEKNIRYLFQICMDCCKEKNVDYIKEASSYIKKIDIKNTNVDFKTKIQYKIIKNRRLCVIKLLASIRRFYLEHLKKTWN